MSRRNVVATQAWDPCRIDNITENTDENRVTVYSVDVLALESTRF